VNRLHRCLAALLILAAACSEDTEAPLEPSLAQLQGSAARVSTNADDGAGSFRAAVEAANADPSIGTIRFAAGLGPIRLSQPVTYSGGQALVILGEGARLIGRGLPDATSALVADGGGNLTLRRLSVTGAPGNGITVKVPDDASGTLAIRLQGVTIRENGLHGILINDQAEYFNDPASTSEEGSPASLLVEVIDSRFERNGFTLIDSDGLRINEGGEGTLEAVVRGTQFVGNGADGLELDERAAGAAVFTLRNVELVGNGAFAEEDLDDGIDVDEGGDGDLVGRFNDVVASRNFEQGVDLNENDAGDLRVTMADVKAVGNLQEGIEFEEDDDVAGGGDIIADLVRITTNGNTAGDAGLKLREKGEGNLSARLAQVLSVDNRAAPDADPVSGVQLREDEGGDLTARLVDVTVRRNGGAGAALEQESPGTGAVTFRNFTATGNDEGAIVAEGVDVTGAP
jgi:hypothetical protein